MSSGTGTHNKRRGKGTSLGEGPTIRESFKKPYFIADYRFKVAVIDAPTTRIMNYCIQGGIIPHDSPGVVWRAVDCCPEGKTDNSKKHWWNI